MTVSDIQKRYQDGATVRQVVAEAIERAKADQNHAVLEVLETAALERADELDKLLAAGKDIGRLAGVPFVAKDNILVFGGKTTASSHMLENFEAPYQATVIERLESEGAICIGKTNLDSFAHGGSTENSYFGPTKNAIDSQRVAGGSSGGSAVAVAAGLVPFALGTDTGGSIRQPASFNGVVGLKPSYGVVSRYGVVAMASSTDVVGPITTNPADAQLVLECMWGVDQRDSTTLAAEKTTTSPTKLRIGVIAESMAEGVDTEVLQRTKDLINKLEKAGHATSEVSLPTMPHALAVYYIVTPAELSSNLARYDGIKYGNQKPGKDLQEVYEQSRSTGFMDENKRRILIGNYVLSSGYYDAYYEKAQTVRTVIIREFKKAFEDFDILLSPTAPTPAFGLGENIDDPLKMYMADIMTVPSSLAGLPAISLPNGTTADGLPIGVQLIAPYRHDSVLLSVSKIVEEVIDND